MSWHRFGGRGDMEEGLDDIYHFGEVGKAG